MIGTESNNRVVFIFNPFSGKQNVAQLERLVTKYKENGFSNFELWPTGKAEDVALFANKAIEEGIEKIVACGGDGTVNEVSKHIVGKDIVMGIIPLGSGNGLARHLKIPMNSDLAIQKLNEGKVIKVDSGVISGEHFINVAGVGFDALISNKFSQETKRGLQGYARVISRELSLKQYDFEIESEEGSWKGESPMICFTNGSQWGNNLKVYKNADLSDGVLECIIFTTKNWFGFGLGILNQSSFNDNYSVLLKSNKFKVKTNCPYFHVDGEPREIVNGEFEVSVRPLSVNVLL